MECHYSDSYSRLGYEYYDPYPDRNKWYQSRPIFGRASASMEANFGECNFPRDPNVRDELIWKIESAFEKIIEGIKSLSQEMNQATIKQGEKLKLLAENLKLLKEEYNEADDEGYSSGEDDSVETDLMQEEQKVFDKMPDPKLRNVAPIKLSEMTVAVNNRGGDKQFAAKKASTAVFVKMKSQGYLGPTLKSKELTHTLVVSDFEKTSSNFGEENILLFDPGGIFVTPSFEFDNLMYEPEDNNRGIGILSDTTVVSNSDFPVNRATIFNGHKLFDEMSQPHLKEKYQIGIAFVFGKNAFNIIEENLIIFDPGGVVFSDMGYGRVGKLESHITVAVTRMDKHLLDAIYFLENKRNVLIFETTLFRRVPLGVQNLGAELDNMCALAYIYCMIPHVDISKMQSICQGPQGQNPYVGSASYFNEIGAGSLIVKLVHLPKLHKPFMHKKVIGALAYDGCNGASKWSRSALGVVEVCKPRVKRDCDGQIITRDVLTNENEAMAWETIVAFRTYFSQPTINVLDLRLLVAYVRDFISEHDNLNEVNGLGERHLNHNIKEIMAMEQIPLRALSLDSKVRRHAVENLTRSHEHNLPGSLLQLFPQAYFPNNMELDFKMRVVRLADFEWLVPIGSTCYDTSALYMQNISNVAAEMDKEKGKLIAHHAIESWSSIRDEKIGSLEEHFGYVSAEFDALCYWFTNQDPCALVPMTLEAAMQVPTLSRDGDDRIQVLLFLFITHMTSILVTPILELRQRFSGKNYRYELHSTKLEMVFQNIFLGHTSSIICHCFCAFSCSNGRGFAALVVWNTGITMTIIPLGKDPQAVPYLSFNHNENILVVVAINGLTHMFDMTIGESGLLSKTSHVIDQPSNTHLIELELNFPIAVCGLLAKSGVGRSTRRNSIDGKNDAIITNVFDIRTSFVKGVVGFILCVKIQDVNTSLKYVEGQRWRPQLLLSCYSNQIFIAHLKSQGSFNHHLLFGSQVCLSPLPYTMFAMLQHHPHTKVSHAQPMQHLQPKPPSCHDKMKRRYTMIWLAILWLEDKPFSWRG